MENILKDKLTASKCLIHKHPFLNICIEENCQLPSRGMCRKCDANHANIVNIENLFDFLKEMKGLAQQDSHIAKAQLYQQFLRQKATLIECINLIQKSLELQISQIPDIHSLQQMMNELLNNWQDQEGTQSLGELFSRTISHNNNEFALKQMDTKHIQNQTLVINLMKQLEESVRKFTQEQTRQFQMGEYILPQTESCQWLCYNDDETQLAAAFDKYIKVFSKSEQGVWIQEGQQLMGPHQDQTYQYIKFIKNSTQLIACGSNLIVTWSKQQNNGWKQEEQIITPNNNNPIKQPCISHDAKLIAHTLDKIINIYEIKRQQIQYYLKKHTLTVNQICFNHNSKLLASGSCDRLIIIWNQNEQGDWQHHQTLTGHNKSVDSVQFSVDSKLLVSGSCDSSIKIWSVDNKQFWSNTKSLYGNDKEISCVYINMSSNAIVSGAQIGIVKVWKLEKNDKWEIISSINGKRWINHAIISNDCQTIVAAIQRAMVTINTIR